MPHEALSPSLPGCPLTLLPLTVQGCSCGFAMSQAMVLANRAFGTANLCAALVAEGPAEGAGGGASGPCLDQHTWLGALEKVWWILGSRRVKLTARRQVACSCPGLVSSSPGCTGLCPLKKNWLCCSSSSGSLQCSLLLMKQGDGLSASHWCLGKLFIYVVYLITGHFLIFS